MRSPVRKAGCVAYDRSALLSRVEWMRNYNSESQTALVRASSRQLGEAAARAGRALPVPEINSGAFVDAGPSEVPAYPLAPSPPLPRSDYFRSQFRGPGGSV